MKIIFGLGNPGSKYELSRHNCGFMTLDRLAAALSCSFGKKEQDNLTASGVYHGQKLLLAKPQSYMNLSGFPLTRLCAFYKVDYSDILVIHDDMDLPAGQLRLRRGGQSGGHNGIKSIIEQTGTTAFNRLKIGIGRPVYDTIDHVLQPIAREDIAVFAAAFDRAAAAALCWADQGIARAMNEYNKALPAPAPPEPAE
ncbi:MAG: aminoacyl-tRNA hydrolase [Firmicutes bacterium]|nr:aminoacyl-tRNA hydrolase [Bacillota bacterium]